MNKTKEFLGIPCDENTFDNCLCYSDENWGSYYEYFSHDSGGGQYFEDESKCLECGMCDSLHYVFEKRDAKDHQGNKTKELLGIYDHKLPVCCSKPDFGTEKDRWKWKDVDNADASFEWKCANCSYSFWDIYKYSHRSQCDRNVDYNKRHEIKEGLRIA